MSPAAVPYELGQIRYLPLRYDSSNSEDSATKLILTLFPDWASGDSQIEFTRFTDGITNTLLKVVNKRPGLSKQELEKGAVLLRAYGSGTAILIDREREVNNHELLMHHDLAPELLARFENGMLYRFVPGTPAQAKDLKDPPVLRAVARRLAHWHATLPCLYYRPSQTNGHRNGANGHRRSIDEKTIGKPSPNVWTTMQKWILALPTETDSERQRQILLQRELEDIVHNLSNRPGLGHNGVCNAYPPTS